MNVFNDYAQFYDALYREKNYEEECRLLSKIFSKFSEHKIASILDLGCGTGNHAFILNKLGYEVLGVDRSKRMLEIAEEKAKKFPTSKSISFHHGDLRNFNINRKADAAIMMFGVLSYMTKNNEVLEVLHSVKNHLHPKSLFIFDVWYGPAVLHQRPVDKTKTVNVDGRKLIRYASSELDILNSKCTVTFRTVFKENKTNAQEVLEHHPMRYFFAQELSLFLKVSGFELISLTQFPTLNKKPTEDSWNVLCVAKLG